MTRPCLMCKDCNSNIKSYCHMGSPISYVNTMQRLMQKNNFLLIKNPQFLTWSTLPVHEWVFSTKFHGVLAKFEVFFVENYFQYLSVGISTGQKRLLFVSKKKAKDKARRKITFEAKSKKLFFCLFNKLIVFLSFLIL